jgi:hypothetical protein
LFVVQCLWGYHGRRHEMAHVLLVVVSCSPHRMRRCTVWNMIHSPPSPDHPRNNTCNWRTFEIPTLPCMNNGLSLEKHRRQYTTDSTVSSIGSIINDDNGNGEWWKANSMQQSPSK